MFPLHQIAEILRAASEDIGLTNPVIKFHLPRRMWSGITNVTDGRQTDGQTDVKRRHHRSIAISMER